MIISPPYLPQLGLTGSKTDTDPMMTAVEDGYEPGYHGVFPITFDRRWHCGIHLLARFDNEPVRAIADGDVVAYRVSQEAISDGHVGDDGKPVLNTNTGFVLLRHTTDTGDGRTLTYYSLYMNLLDLNEQKSVAIPQPATPPQNSSPVALAAWLLQAGDGVQQGGGKKVYRKDILGYQGQSQGLRHLHHEIFMTESDYSTWFESSDCPVQLGVANPVQPTSKDWWGHAYFVIPASAEFRQRPGTAYDDPWLPALNAGTLPNSNSKLYVEVYFHQGQRYMNAWLDENGDGTLALLTKEPVVDPYADYEYNLYQRATALYPTCPSDGYELLRFGRILSDKPTLTSASDMATWVAVPVDASGTLSYVDINKASVIKLSDADFPSFMGWQKIDSDNAPTGDDGLFSYAKLRRLVNDAAASTYEVPSGDPKFSLDDQMAYYVQRNDSVRYALGRFVCHTVSEWDPLNNAKRYQDLNQPDGYFGKTKDTDPDGYEQFDGFLKQIQFMDQIPALSGSQKFWYFHPLVFIRHFRKCGWLSLNELTQLLPRKYGLNHAGSTLTWETAHGRVSGGTITQVDLSEAFRKYGFLTVERQIAFLSQAYIETGLLRTVSEDGEGHGSGNAQYYQAFYGRGLMQLTWPTLYDDYGEFRKFPPNSTGRYTDARITQTSTHYWSGPPSVDSHGHVHSDIRQWYPRYDPNVVVSSRQNACDSAGFFSIWKHFMGITNILRIADAGITTVNVGRMSILVNGGGNGYDDRQQYAAYIFRYRSDTTDSTGGETLTYAKQRIVPHPHQTPTWGEATTMSNVYVDFTPQRPA